MVWIVLFDTTRIPQPERATTAISMDGKRVERRKSCLVRYERQRGVSGFTKWNFDGVGEGENEVPFVRILKGGV